jgi:hypothetical protein
MFVPIVQISIHPVQDEQHPSTEKTDRQVRAPSYMFPLFKTKWGPRAKVTQTAVNDSDNLWKVPLNPGMSYAESEAMRLKNYFKDGGKTFALTYPGDSFEAAFDKVAVETNPEVAKREARDANLREESIRKAGVGLLQAAGDVAVSAERTKQKAKATRALQVPVSA